jgi:hypothetical protein
MSLYTFQGLTLEVRATEEQTTRELDGLLQNLQWVRTAPPAGQPVLFLSVRLHAEEIPNATRGSIVFRDYGFCGREHGDAFFLTDGASLLHLQPQQGQGEALLAPSFFAKPALVRRHFWVFGLLKLLRPFGFYNLHAAGVINPTGKGLLVIGASGSGKSTLTIGLIRHGWSYLSDDVVLLRLQPYGVEALAGRKHFYVDAAAAPAYAGLPLGEEVADLAGGRRQQVHIEEVYPEQYVPRCLPRVLLFARIVPRAQSTVLPLDHVSALKHLLAQSGRQFFDRRTMAPHLEVLRRLLQQTVSYELQAGLDLYYQPLTSVHLLAEAEGEEQWRGL